MNTRLIIQETAGQVRVGVLPAGVIAPSWSGKVEPWDPPLSGREAEDLRWYLEEYLRAPFAVWEDRGESIRQLLPQWGGRLFQSVFGDGRRAEAYAQGRNAVKNTAVCSGDVLHKDRWFASPVFGQQVRDREQTTDPVNDAGYSYSLTLETSGTVRPASS